MKINTAMIIVVIITIWCFVQTRETEQPNRSVPASGLVTRNPSAFPILRWPGRGKAEGDGALPPCAGHPVSRHVGGSVVNFTIGWQAEWRPTTRVTFKAAIDGRRLGVGHQVTFRSLHSDFNSLAGGVDMAMVPIAN